MLWSKASLHELRGGEVTSIPRLLCAVGLALVTAVASAAAQDTSQPPLNRVVEVANGGTVTGAVRFADEFPPAETLRSRPTTRFAGLPSPVTISSSQESCDYTPHVQVFKSKDKLTVLNKDLPAAQRPHCRG